MEALRCPRPHQETVLVASASRTVARHVVDGVLGCPVCGAEFEVSSGVVHIDAPVHPTPAEKPSAEIAMRLAAFLELTDARGFALLCGRWGAHADEILRLSETPLVLVNPPRGDAADVAGVLLVRDAMPFAAGAARAAAVDTNASTALVRSVVRAVRPGGRVIGPTAVALPEGVTELVRDEQVWVAEKTAASDSPPQAPRLVSLKRAPQ